MTTRPETGEVGDLLSFEQLEIVQEEVLPVVPGSAEDMFGANGRGNRAGNVTNGIGETDVGNVTNIDETTVGMRPTESDVGNVTNIDETTVGMRPAESDVDMRPTEGDDDDDIVLNYDPSSDEEDVIMTSEPEVVEISDIVGQLAHKNYFVQLCDGNFYHYPTDKIYGLIMVRPEMESPPMIWKRIVTDSEFENGAEVAPLWESGFEIHFNSGKIYCGNARVVPTSESRQ